MTDQIKIIDPDLRDLVETRVRAEHEAEITAEIERRLAAVEAAISGGIEPPPPPRKPRSDKGTRRGPIKITAPPDARDPESALPDAADGPSPVCTCDHFASVHADGNGKCLLRTCKCERFVQKDPLDSEPI